LNDANILYSESEYQTSIEKYEELCLLIPEHYSNETIFLDQWGANLAEIAQKYHSTIQSIREFNDLPETQILIRVQNLEIPSLPKIQN
jgi:hypothetical protein